MHGPGGHGRGGRHAARSGLRPRRFRARTHAHRPHFRRAGSSGASLGARAAAAPCGSPTARTPPSQRRNPRLRPAARTRKPAARQPRTAVSAARNRRAPHHARARTGSPDVPCPRAGPLEDRPRTPPAVASTRRTDGRRQAAGGAWERLLAPAGPDRPHQAPRTGSGSAGDGARGTRPPGGPRVRAWPVARPGRPGPWPPCSGRTRAVATAVTSTATSPRRHPSRGRPAPGTRAPGTAPECPGSF